MVDINRVYQTVLSVLNKEQRGYVTPEEFNQYAAQAQKEIFDVYFFKLGRASAQSEIDPMVENIPFDILEKIQIFEQSQNISIAVTNTIGNTTFASVDLGAITPQIYRLETILAESVQVMKVTKTMLGNMLKSPLTAPTNASPVYYRIGGMASTTNQDIVRVYGITAASTSPVATPPTELDLFYYREPVTPVWAGAVANGQLVPNPSLITNFELHPGEEPELVANILSYAGISVRAQDVAQAAASKYSSISQAES